MGVKFGMEKSTKFYTILKYKYSTGACVLHSFLNKIYCDFGQFHAQLLIKIWRFDQWFHLRVFCLRLCFPPNFQRRWWHNSDNCTSDVNPFYRFTNSMDLYHHAKFGGARTSPPQESEKV